MSRLIPCTLLLTLILSLAAAPGALAKKPRVRHSAYTPAAGERGGYLTRDITGPGGERVPIMDVPGSATVINRQILDDQQATTLGQALRNVSGVTVRH
jgi:catecholate siderophore receptor